MLRRDLLIEVEAIRNAMAAWADRAIAEHEAPSADPGGVAKELHGDAVALAARLRAVEKRGCTLPSLHDLVAEADQLLADLDSFYFVPLLAEGAAA